MMQETDVGNEQLKLTSTRVLHTSFSVKGVKRVSHISRVTSDRVWVSDLGNIILTDKTGDIIHRVADASLYGGGLHTVNSSSELIYIDTKLNIKILSKKRKTVTTLLESPTSQWGPVSVYCSPSTGDLMVGMYNTDTDTGKINRYNSARQIVLTIQHNSTGHTLYSAPRYITENKNGDIIVSDVHHVVVTERMGRHRFSYTGHPSGSSLSPWGICTDALSHILVCDYDTRTVQMIDRDGHFLSLLLTQQHGIYKPCGLNYDDKTHLLWVGSEDTNTVSVYIHIQRRYSLTDDLGDDVASDDSVDDDDTISKSTDKKKITEHTSKKPESRFLALPGKGKRSNTPASTLTRPVHIGNKRKIGNVQSSIEDEVPGPSVSKPKIPGEGSLESAVTDFVYSWKHDIIDVDMPDYAEMPTKKMKYWEGTIKHDYSVDDDEKISKSTDKKKITDHTGRKLESKYLALHEKGKRTNIPASTLTKPVHIDDSVDDDEKISTDEKKIREHTGKNPESRFLTFPWKGKRTNIPASTLTKPVHLGKSKKHFSAMTEKLMTFSKQLQQLRENGEADIRSRFLVDSLDLEIKPSQLSRHQIKSKDYREIIYTVGYLDCAGLNLVEGRKDITMKSFFQTIKPFSGCNVQHFLKWMKDCQIVLRKTKLTKLGSVCSVLFLVYTKKAILGFKEKDLDEIIDHSVRCAIKSDSCILVSELVRTYLFDRDIKVPRIFKDIKGISPAIIDTILQTVRNLIQRKFRNLQNNGIVLSFCWECGKENRLVMVMSYRGKIELSDRIPNEVLGFKLVLYNFTQPSEEASSVLKSVPFSKKTPLPTVTEGEARELFRKHSNLTMISASPYKSTGYSKGKRRIVEKPCICLFCFHKGYIPYREDRFPNILGEFEVDVQEGYSVLGSGASLEIGGYICRSGCGSIGGFVDLPNNKTGLITCAHVIFSSEELKELESLNGVPAGTEVKAFDRKTHSYRVCGTCTAAEFPKCFQQATSPHPNVDAVLIELDPAIETFRLRTVSSDQLYSAGFDSDSPPEFSGDVVRLPDPHPVHRICERIPDKLDSVVKYGVETGLTIGHLYHSGVHIRFISDNLKLPDNSQSALMCDQIEIQNLPQGQFFECGDSGSFVFCINPDKTLSCLGMAVGLSLPQKSCLVTPIDRILRSVCPPSACLKPCSSATQQTNASSATQQTNAPPQATLDMILSAIGNFQVSLQSVQANFQSSLQSVENNFQTSLQSVETNFQTSLQSVETNFQTSLHNVERNVEKNFQASLQNVERNIERNFQTSLQNTERNFQASLQNIQTEVQTLQTQVQQSEDSETQSTSNQSSVNNN